MPKLLMLCGIAASGKSTFAKKLVAENQYVRVNKDSLRELLHEGKFSKGNEKQVLRIRDQIVEDALSQGRNVVVDDTNLHPKHKETLEQLAKKHNATFETKFFPISLEEAIKRDLKRVNSVGEKVIRNMYYQYIAEPAVYVPPEGKPQAIICDIDGTLAHIPKGGRSPYAFDRVQEDTIDTVVRNLLLLHHAEGIKIIILSGRDAVCKDQTEKWLVENDVPYDGIYMRPEENGEADTVIKKELYDKHIRDNYQVQFVIDDRRAVCDFWLSIGLKVLNVSGLDRGEF